MSLPYQGKIIPRAKELRFSNLDVERNFQGVCTAIDLAVRERAEQLSTDE